MLTISPEKVFFILVKAREFDVKVEPADSDSGSNPTDDGCCDILEDEPDDPTYQELLDAMTSLNEDEMAGLLALAWIGRGDFGPDEWEEALAQGFAEIRDPENRPPPLYLAGMPLLGDYLEEGLGQLEISCEEFEIGRL